MSARGIEQESITLTVDGQKHVIDIAGCTTAEEVNARIASLSLGARARVATPAERRKLVADHQRERRAALIAEIRQHPEAEVKNALADAKRKGWGLEGLSLEKLQFVASYLRPDGDL